MSVHVKVIFKVLPGRTGRRAVGGQARGSRAQNRVEAAAPSRSGEPGPGCQLSGVRTPWNWHEVSGKEIRGEVGGAQTGLLHFPSSNFQRSNNCTSHFLLVSKPRCVLSWDLSGALITTLSTLFLWVPIHPADIGVHKMRKR